MRIDTRLDRQLITSSRQLLEHLVPHRRIIQRNTHRTAMMPIVLPNNTLAPQLPQPRVMITTRGNQIRAVGAERAVPHPSLVSMQRRLEREGGGIALCCAGQGVAGLNVVRGREVDGPDARGVIGGAGCQVAHVGGEQDAGDVGVVG